MNTISNNAITIEDQNLPFEGIVVPNDKTIIRMFFTNTFYS